MVKCSNENIYYSKRKKPSKSKTRRFFKILSVLLIFFSIYLYYKNIVFESVFFAVSSYAKDYSLDSINKAAESVLKSQNDYGDFITIEKNAEGNVVMIKSNSFNINSIKTEMVIKTQNNLQKKIAEGVNIPSMVFSGVKFLSGYGRNINFKSLSVSSVNADFESEFKSVGINQTLHSIYVNVFAEINVSTCGKEKTTSCSSKILVSEAVILGKVPEIYLNGNLF